MAAHVKKNSSRIRSKFRTGGLLWAVLIGAFAAGAAMLGLSTLHLPSNISITGGLLAGGAVLAVCAVISLFVSGNRAKGVLRQVDDRASFDEDYITEAGSSNCIFLGENWFVWNKGRTFSILKREDIASARIHPQSAPGNDLGLLLVEKKDGTTLQLAYHVEDGVDLPAIINEWCREPDVPEVPAEEMPV